MQKKKKKKKRPRSCKALRKNIRRLRGANERNSKLQTTVKNLEDKALYLEAYSRRENIKFENIPEATQENTDKEVTESEFYIIFCVNTILFSILYWKFFVFVSSVT